jgi:hypothetical protein
MARQPTEEEIVRVVAMDRPQLVDTILSANWGFPIDLSKEYLLGLNVDQLRHLYMALSTCGRRAHAASPAASA